MFPNYIRFNLLLGITLIVGSIMPKAQSKSKYGRKATTTAIAAAAAKQAGKGPVNVGSGSPPSSVPLYEVITSKGPGSQHKSPSLYTASSRDEQWRHQSPTTSHGSHHHL